MEIEEYIKQLKSCKTEQEFKNIWKPKKFNWIDYSYYLCQYCSDYFNIWWDPDKFNWEYFSNFLCQYCSEHFDIWWNSEKFDWNYSNLLCEYDIPFNKWWNPEKFDWNYSFILCMYRLNYFNIWWYPNKFNWKDDLKFLQKYCQDYKHIWEKDFLKWKLKNI